MGAPPAVAIANDPLLELTEVETEIERAQAALKQLIEKRVIIQRRINSFYSPIHRLPAEILSEIFMACYPVNNHEQWVSETPLLLGSVCSAWRVTSWSTPQLWSTISLTIHEDNHSKDKFIIFRDWLVRAREQPLSIALDYSSTFIGDYESYYSTPDQQAIQDTLSLVTQYYKQWEIISLEMHESLRVFGDSFPEDFPQLKSLRLFGEAYQADDVKAFHSAPQLHEVYLHRFISPATAALHLPQNPNMRLTLDGGTVHDCLHVLRQRSNLVHFGIENLLLPRVNTVFEPATAPLLRSLEVTHVTMGARHPTNGTGAFRLLANLTAPMLRSLVVGSRDDSWFEALELAGFISRSNCPLTKLSISCDSIDIGGCLSLTPALMELDLCVGDMGTDDWMELAVNKDFTIAPILTRLTYTYMDGETLDCIGLARMLASRRQPITLSPDFFLQLIEFKLVYIETVHNSLITPIENILEESMDLRIGEVQ